MSEQPRSGGLDPETLAAYVDGHLPPEERAKVEAEIAADPETYEWLVHVLRVSEAAGHAEQKPELVPAPAVVTPSDELWNLTPDGRVAVEVPQPAPALTPVPTPARVLPFFARPGVRAAIGTLLTAAAVVLVVRMQPSWWQRLTGSDVDPRVASLVAAVGEERYIEGRLTGGFKYGPLRSVTRGPEDLSNQNLALLAAAGELQKKAQEDPSAENLHAWGVAQVLMGDAAEAVQSLEDAALLNPKDASVIADLAAALLAEGSSGGPADAFPRALDRALEAIELEPNRPEAYFTAAVALERLSLTARARNTWQQYLKLAKDDGWTQEARRRLQALDAQPPSAQWREFESLGVRAPLNAKDRQLVSGPFRGEVPELVFGALGAWAAGHDEGLDRARELAAIAGERFFEEVSSVEAGLRDGGESVRRGLGSLAGGVAAFEQDQYSAAQEELVAAMSSLARRFPYLRDWAAYYLARASYGVGEVATTRKLLEPLCDANAMSESDHLYARARWIRGIVNFSSGDWQRAREDYEEARKSFEGVSDHLGAANVDMNLSILSRFFGDTSDAWAHRVSGLSRGPRHRPQRWNGYLVSVATSSSIDGFHRVALVVADEAVANAANLAPHIRANASEQRARILAAIDRVDDAKKDIAAARSHWETIGDEGLKARMASAIETATARVAYQSDPQMAIGAAQRALEIARTREETLRSAETAIYLGGAFLAAGNAASAGHAIAEGISAFERARKTMPIDDPVRLSTFEPVWRLFDQAVAVELVQQQQDQERLFAAIERSRARTLLELARGGRPSLFQVQSQLDRGTVILLLHQRETSLLAWTIRRDDSQYRELPLTPSASRRLVSRFQRSLQTHYDDAEAEQGLRAIAELADSPHDELLIVVPDDAYWSVPWAAIRDRSGRRAIERKAVAISPSATLAAASARTASAPRSALAIGSPQLDSRFAPLVASRDEILAVAALYPSAVTRLDDRATPATLLAEAPLVDVVHVSTHAVESVAFPLLSRLLLSKDRSGNGELSVHDVVQRLRLKPSTLVVLATCASIGTRSKRGEGSIGLAWGYLAAGAATVVGTLWEVRDREAKDLFVDFHKRLRAGLSAPMALRGAQRLASERGVPASEWGAVQTILQVPGLGELKYGT